MPEPSSPSIDPFILDALRRGKCIVITGPDLLRLKGGTQSLRKDFHQARIEQGLHARSFLTYYEQEELYLFENAPQQTRFYFAMEPFFHQPVHEQPYRQLSELPVSLYLNGSPDLTLRKQLDQVGSFAFFHKGSPNQELPDFTRDRPLVYNLLGSIEEEESLILTHDDLFQFLERIFAEGQVPRGILDALFDARCLLFLGVGFDKWYVQLLLRLLRVNDDRYARYATPKPQHPQTLSICTDQFQIKFVNHGIEEFVEALHARCAEEGLLLSRATQQRHWYQEVVRLVSTLKLEATLDRIDQRLEQLQAHGKNVDESSMSSLQLSGELGRLGRRRISKMITEEAYEVKRNLLGERIRLLATNIYEEHG